MPSLLSLPYLGFVSANDTLYQVAPLLQWLVAC